MKTLSFGMLSLMLLSLSLNAQDASFQSPKQNVFFETFGQGIATTINYDTRFTQSDAGIGGRMGVGYTIFSEKIQTLSIPIVINYLIGKKGHYFEIGAGVTVVHNTIKEEGTGIKFIDESFKRNEGFSSVGTMHFGYRYQPVDGGFNLRVGCSPIFSAKDKGYFIPYYPSISWGYTLP